jgi:membrane-associated protease RseP (regulator of RpoE activity)
MNKPILIICMIAVVFYNCTKLNESPPKVKVTNTPWLGIELEQKEKLLMVNRVISNSPAAHAGIQTGDVLISFNKTPISDIESIHKAIQTLGVSKKTSVIVDRVGKSVTLALRPSYLMLLDENVMSWSEGYCDRNCNCKYDTLGECVTIYRYRGPNSRGGSNFSKYCTDSNSGLHSCYSVILL